MSGFPGVPLGVVVEAVRVKPGRRKLKHLGHTRRRRASLAYARARRRRREGALGPAVAAAEAADDDGGAGAGAGGAGGARAQQRSSTGFKGVSHHLSSSKVKPYQARLCGGKTRHLGNFATAEAALAHARALAGNEEDLPCRSVHCEGGGGAGAARKRKKKGDDEALRRPARGRGGRRGGRRRRRRRRQPEPDAALAVAGSPPSRRSPPPRRRRACRRRTFPAAPPAVGAAADAGYDAAGGLANLHVPGVTCRARRLQQPPSTAASPAERSPSWRRDVATSFV